MRNTREQRTQPISNIVHLPIFIYSRSYMIIEVILKDTRGWSPGTQYILHAGQVVWFGDSFQIVQITEIHFMHNY